MSHNSKYIEHDSTFVSHDACIDDAEIKRGAKVFRFVEVRGGSVGEFSSIGDNSVLLNSEIGDYVNINRRNDMQRSKIGSCSYTGMNCVLRSCFIGKFCSISWNVSIGGKNHDFSMLTTSPIWRLQRMHKGRKAVGQANVNFGEKDDCIIGNDVWIGSNSVILRNVTVGNGAVIGAGAVVTKDVPAYSIVAGVPAKAVKTRFDDETIRALEEIAWWNWPTEVILENSELIYSSKVDAQVLDRMSEVAATL